MRAIRDRALNTSLRGSTVFAFWSKDRAQRDAFARGIAGDDTVHLCPRMMLNHVAEAQPRSQVVALEDLPDRDTFLRLHAVVGPETRLILEGTARYTKIDSPQFRCLHRLRRLTTHRFLVDSAPFTATGAGGSEAAKARPICKLYLPLSYLDREILGYSHGYAFEANYAEQDAEGRVRRAHDMDFLAQKVAPWAHLDGPFLLPIEVVEVALTAAERAAYQQEKRRLFDAYNNPRKIVTRLCDAANLMTSRREALIERLREMGDALVLTNITRNSDLLAREAKRAGLGRVRCSTYTVHDGAPIAADTVVLYETPLNANQISAFDVLGDIAPGTRVVRFQDDSKADVFLRGEVLPGWEAVDAFTRALAAEQRVREEKRTC